MSDSGVWSNIDHGDGQGFVGAGGSQHAHGGVDVHREQNITAGWECCGAEPLRRGGPWRRRRRRGCRRHRCSRAAGFRHLMAPWMCIGTEYHGRVGVLRCRTTPSGRPVEAAATTGLPQAPMFPRRGIPPPAGISRSLPLGNRGNRSPGSRSVGGRAAPRRRYRARRPLGLDRSR